jgi:hypothetical protein
MVSSAKDLLESKMFGLAVACPYWGGNPCKCPFHEIRKKSLLERHEWAKRLSETEALNYLTFHQFCLQQKESPETDKPTTFRNL